MVMNETFSEIYTAPINTGMYQILHESTGSPQKKTVTAVSGEFKPQIWSLGIMVWQSLTGDIGKGMMRRPPTIPVDLNNLDIASMTVDQIDRLIDTLTDQQRLDLVMSLAGTRPDMEEDTDEDWGFYDWNTPDDVSD